MKPTIGANTKKREIAALEAQDILARVPTHNMMYSAQGSRHVA